MFRHVLLLASTTPLLACSTSLQHGVQTTDAAVGLQQVTRSQVNELDPAVSPDAKAIAYEVAAPPGATPHVEVMSLADVGAAHPRVEYTSGAVPAATPAWMPDGSAIVFRATAPSQARIVETIGDGVQATRFLGPIGVPDLDGAWPSVSPDVRKLAVSLGRLQLFESDWRTATPLDAAIGVSDLSGSGLTVLGPGTEPAWSPHGRRIAFVRETDGRTHVYVANADGSDARQITDGPEDERQPAWSPGGRRIVFCSMRRNGEGWIQANLFAVQPDSSGLVQLTEGDRLACRPDWASDGFVYFHANVGGRFHIWRLRPRRLGP